MASNPPQAEDLRYWLKRFEALRRQKALEERVLRLETDAVLREALDDRTGPSPR